MDRLFADAAEAALRSEGDKGYGLVFRQIEAQWPSALFGAQIDHVSCEGRFDGYRPDFGAEPEAGHRIPVGMRAVFPDLEAGIARDVGGDLEPLHGPTATTAENAAVDH